MTRPLAMRSSCICKSIRSISTLRSARVGFDDWGTFAPSFPRDLALWAIPILSRADRSGSGVHRLEEVRVALRFTQLAEQEFYRVHRAHRIEDTPEHVHLLQDVRRD